MKKIFEYFPDKIKQILIEEIKDKENKLEEIRIRNQKPIILKFYDEEIVVRYNVSSEEILSILQLICENSIYSYQKQISYGFVTLQGGHRVGITGSCVIEENKIININYINSFNFRIAKQVIGCSNKLLSYILNFKNNSVFNTLIISPPGCGKTTILRDVTRQISSGNRSLMFKGINVGVVDERSEIASLYKGVPQNDVGIKTDIIENASKATGINMLVRSMAPKVIVADEIGSPDDVDAINYAICSGCKGIFSAHGNDFDDIYLNPVLKNLLNNHSFEVLIFLDTIQKGEIKEVYVFDKKILQYVKKDN